MEATTLSEARVYVGTYGKYNNGSLFGTWLNLSDYLDKEDFYEACRELHKDEEDAEFMFRCGGAVGRHRAGSLFRVVQLQKP